MNSKRRVALLSLTLITAGEFSHLYGFASKNIPGTSYDTHAQLTQNSLLIIGAFGPNCTNSSYPDLCQYRNQILLGGSSEGILPYSWVPFAGIGAHNSVDGSITYWYLNDPQWRNDARATSPRYLDQI